MTEMPDVIRRAMEAQGKFDPDAALEAASTAIPSDEHEVAEQQGEWRELLPDEQAPEVELSEAERAMVQGSLLDPPDRTGIRGGTTKTYEEGEALLDAYRHDDVRRVRDAILGVAADQGYVHADDVAFVQVEQRNAVGVAFKMLADEGWIAPTEEHRASKLPAAHGRRSYVYQSTEKLRKLLDG